MRCPPISLCTLGDHIAAPGAAHPVTVAERFRQFVRLGELAEHVGFRALHVGEHHFNDYILSSPTPVLAAVAERTSDLRLSTAVSLLGNHDPVRIAEDYGTVDALSNGRVELVAGRGILDSVYAQFGQDALLADDYLAEAVELLRLLWTGDAVTWRGALRAPLDGVVVHPRPVQRPHPPIALSASSERSIERAVRMRCPIVIPTVSTGPDLPARLAAMYRASWRAAGLPPDEAGVRLHVHCYVGPTTTAAAIEFWRSFQVGYLSWVLSFARPGAGLPPMFTELGTPAAQAVCGNADDVAAELARRISAMGGVDGLLVQSDQGGLPFDDAEASISRFSRDVLPRLDALLADAITP